MTLSRPLPPHHEYRAVLLDFRAQLFKRFLWAVLLFIGMLINISLFQQPRPVYFMGVMILFLLAFSQIGIVYRTRPNLARYSFVLLLYLLLFSLMQLQTISWTIYLIIPVMLVSALLVSNSIHIITLGFCTYLLTILQPAIDISDGIISLILINYIAIMISVSTFNVALSWYSSMHHHADALLKESRERRAELVSTLKSLDTAYQTRRRLQQQLVYARQQAEDARRMKERFASNISHELRTPLNIILGFSEIMHLTPEIYGDIIFPPKLHRDIYQIHHNSRHLLSMIDDVLDLSHVELSEFSLNFETTNLCDFLKDAVELLAHQFDDSPVEFITAIPDDLPAIDIDRTRIRQVFINLITNARRFTDAGSVSFTARAHENHVEFIVTDTGHGISEENRQLIFEEFYQVDYSLSRQHGGAGLGLAITKQFVEAHNGKLAVDSEYGRGSTFTISLPRPERQQASLARSTGTATGTLPDVRDTILLVGSDSLTPSLLSRHLAHLNLVEVPDSESIDDYIVEYNPVAIVHNRLQGQQSLESLDIPIIECSLPGPQWLRTNLQVDASLEKPVSPQQVAEILNEHPLAEKLLIVDDDIGFVQLMQRSIEGIKRDYIIRRAYDGEQAYNIIQEDTPDLIFLDLAMPEMNGLELIDLLREQDAYRNIIIILLTATRYLQFDNEWASYIKIHKKNGINTRRTLDYIKPLLNSMIRR